MTSFNFDIRIHQLADGRYPVEAMAADGRRTRQTSRQTFDIQAEALRDLRHYLNDLVARPDDARQLGAQLWQLLFPRPVRDLFIEQRGLARQAGQNLRLRLQIDPPELAQFAWEYLFDPDEKQFLALTYPLVRYQPEPIAEEVLAVPQPLKILLAIASPSDQPTLDVAAEEAKIREALADVAGQVEIQVLSVTTVAALQQALRRYQPHICHFVGHGLIANGLAALALVHEESGQTQPLDAEGIRPLFQGSSVKVAVLHACHSAEIPEGREAVMGITPALIRAGLPAVLGMQTLLPDKLAIAFARDLYTALADGLPLDNAVLDLRKSAYAGGQDKTHWGIPALFLRSPDGVIWQPAPPQPAVPEALHPYLKIVAQRTNTLPLAPLDPKGRDSAAISLRQVFINLDAGLMQRQAASSQPDHIRHIQTKSALAHVYHNQRLILLGDPGSGKSTLLRFLAYCLAQAALEPQKNWRQRLRWQEQHLDSLEGDAHLAWSQVKEQQSRHRQKEAEKAIQEVETYWRGLAPIPVFIELRDFARTNFDPQSPLALWHFVAAQWRQEGLEACVEILERLARQGRVLFLLDGVDEVPLKQRPAIWQAISRLADSPFLDCRWLTTCRILSFDANEAPKGVAEQTLAHLNQGQIEQFIGSWYAVLRETGELSKEQAAQMTQQLQRAAQRRRLQPLAQNPMLLTIMALVQTYHGTLPEERAVLYQRCVETLLLRWQRHKEREGETELPDLLTQLETTQLALESLLWEIAWQAHRRAPQRDEAADIAETEVMKIAAHHLGSYGKAEDFIRYTENRAHLLIGYGGRENRVYRFPHRTFQEYLAACFLASQREFTRAVPVLAGRGDTWREVLNLATGTLVFNQKNVVTALDGVREALPAAVPKPGDAAGWYRVWLAGEMMLVVGLDAAQKDRVGRAVLPRLRQVLALLVSTGRLTPPQRAEAGDALGLLGDPRPGVCTREPEMIPIAAGAFLMHEEKVEVHVAAFAIAKYPVTGAQFAFFVADGGYDNRDYWTEAGWRYRQEEKWTEPRYWQDTTYQGANRPVVGVSWYEAVAYCNWLSAVTGRYFRLPTEAQWERAARHTDGRTFPWGDEWRDGIVNSEEAGVGRTTAVGSFPHGAAVCSAQDMSGNVWEWCSTRWRDEKGKDYPLPYQANDGREDLSGSSNVWRVWRGGAFHFDYRGMRAAFRGGGNPYYRYNLVGLRVVEHLSDPGS